MLRVGLRVCVFAVVALLATAAHADARRDVIDLLNAHRTERALPPVFEDSRLSAAAQGHVDDMAARGYAALDAPGGPRFDSRVARTGYRPLGLARTVLFGDRQPAEVAREVMNSPRLAAVVLSDRPLDVGVGYRGTPFTVKDRGVATGAWTVVVAIRPPDPLADPVPVLLAEVNRARDRRGVAPVRLNDRLSRAAVAHAEDMIRRGYFDHVAPDGGTPADRLRRAAYDYLTYGENLAAGQGSPRAAVEGWDGSPGHARTMYDTAFDEVGLAYRLGPIERRSGTSYHVWVSVYGRGIGAPLHRSDAAVDLWEGIRDRRVADGGPPIRLTPELTTIAEDMADDMVRRGYLDVDAPRGGPTLNDRVALVSDRYRSLNAVAVAGQTSAAEVLAELGAGGHDRAIRNRAFADIGIAYRFGPVEVGGADYHHVWVLLFGRPR